MKTCQRCGYQWQPRAVQPKSCPACKSYKWNLAKDKPAKEIVKEVDAAAPEPEPDDDWIYLDKPTYEGGEILHWRRRPKGQPVIWKRESDLGV